MRSIVQIAAVLIWVSSQAADREQATEANGWNATIVREPRFSASRGFYDTPITVEISTRTAGAEIRWTTNGASPSAVEGKRYTGPVTIAGTTCLRAVALRNGLRPSEVVTHTYLFLDQVIRQSATQPGFPTTWQAGYPADYGMDSNVVNHPKYGSTIKNDLRSIPTLSVVTSHDSLWDPANGIYVDASRSGRVWERAASAELIHPDGTTAFALNCGLRMQGNYSRDNTRTAKHSFRLLFKSAYGPAKLNYDWFPGSPVARFDNIVLRACFTDSWATRYSPPARGEPERARYRPETALYLRDVWMKDSLAAMGRLSGRGGFVHLYLNGLYWGLYNPTERLDASFFAAHLGGKKEDWDVIRDFGEVLDGTKNEWDRMMAMVNDGIASEAAYRNLEKLVDIDCLIDYMLLHIFAEAEDWPEHNWYAARRGATKELPATRWVFLVWDQEIALYHTVRRNKIDADKDDTPARIYAQLRRWPKFRRLFAERVEKHLSNDGALTASNNIARLRARAAQIDRAVVGESARWGDARKFPIAQDPGTGQTFTRDEWWNPELEKLCTSLFPALNAACISRLRTVGLYPKPSMQ